MAVFGKRKGSSSELDDLFGAGPSPAPSPRGSSPSSSGPATGSRGSGGTALDEVWSQVAGDTHSGHHDDEMDLGELGLGQIDEPEQVAGPGKAAAQDQAAQASGIAGRLARRGKATPTVRPASEFEELLAREVFGVAEKDVDSTVSELVRSGGRAGGGSSPARGPGSGRFDPAALAEASQAAAAARAERERAGSVDVGAMTAAERKAYIEALGDSLGLYEHLLAIKPRERYVFRSDYYQIDGGGACACILSLFHKDETRDEFPIFWGYHRVPRDLPDGVKAVVIETVERRDEKWIDDALKRADKLDRLEEREQNDGGTMSTRRSAAKAADDLFSTVAELQDGASYLNVHNRLLLQAPSLEALDSAVERLGRQYIEDFNASVTAAAYHGQQRQELSTLLGVNKDKEGKGFGFSSTEYAGSYSLLTNGLTDPAGEFVGQMSGDYNDSAILFEVDRWNHHVVVADSAINHNLGRVQVSDMWGSKISQAALLNNHRVVHLVLNGADLEKLGPPLRGITAKLDMTKGDVNMFEMFGERKDQISLYGVHLNKLVLMTEQALGAADPAAVSIIRSELKDLLTNFYVHMRMWAHAAEENQDKLRLVGLDHNEVPRLQHFVPYLDTMHKSLLEQANADTDAQRAVKTLQGVFKDMLNANSDLFNQHTSYELDATSSARRVVYDFSGLAHRGKGIAMAQLVNVVGFAVSSLQEGDVLMIHGADQITDSQVQDYLKAQFERLFKIGARVAYLYDSPDAMLATAGFNKFERADYTILGPMGKEVVADYERAIMTAVPNELKAMLAAVNLSISYLRRGSVNVVFTTQLSLGLEKLRRSGPGAGVDEAASRVKEINRNARIEQSSQMAQLEREEAEAAQARAQALDAPPSREPERARVE